MLTIDEYKRLRKYCDNGANMPCGSLTKMGEFEEAHGLVKDIGNGSQIILPLQNLKYKQ